VEHRRRAFGYSTHGLRLSVLMLTGVQRLLGQFEDPLLTGGVRRQYDQVSQFQGVPRVAAQRTRLPARP